MGAAKHSAAYRQMGWYVDKWSAARIRIRVIWKQHPEFTAKQVLEKLGPQQSLRLRWVQHILSDCRRGSARRGPKQSWIGRRFYYSWR